MASQQCVLDYMCQALWDPHPTKTDLRARQLAVALGYPLSWRVVRTIEQMSASTSSSSSSSSSSSCIVDRIYAGKPGTGCDMWYHHEAAMKAAENWDDATSTPYDSQGGHLLPRQPLYGKGDKVQVLYEDKWWDASILKRKEHKEGFRYQVHYSVDGTKQTGVDEELLRRRPEAPDPKIVAASLGFGEGWEAFATGHNRWKIVSPNGDTYQSKKQAMVAYNQSLKDSKDVGDPPWRTGGNDYLGKTVVYTLEHKPSSRRTVKIEQTGKVTGWISETDVDRSGEPGFVSERTGKPARLFHVVFDEVRLHPYASVLLDSTDLEEYEIQRCLVPEEEEEAAGEEPPKKKARNGK